MSLGLTLLDAMSNILDFYESGSDTSRSHVTYKKFTVVFFDIGQSVRNTRNLNSRVLYS